MVSLPVEPSLPVESSQARNNGAIPKKTNALAVHNRANLLSPVDVEVISCSLSLKTQASVVQIIQESD